MDIKIIDEKMVEVTETVEKTTVNTYSKDQLISQKSMMEASLATTVAIAEAEIDKIDVILKEFK